MLDATGDLGLGLVGEFELVEDIACFTGVAVWIPQPIEERAWIVRAGGGQFLMSGLQAKRRRHLGKARVERHQLDFYAGFLFLVGKGLPHAERRLIGGICKANLVVPVVGSAGPEPDGIDRRRVRPILAFSGDLGLMRVDAGLVIGAIDAGNMVESIVLGNRS